MARRRSGSGATKPRRRQSSGAAKPMPQPRLAPSSGRDSGATKSSETVEPQALVVTYSFDPGDIGGPYDATVRLSGRRVGLRGVPRAGDTFTRDEKVDGVVPGSGPVSITAWVYGLHQGEWEVDARLLPTDTGLRSAGTRPPSSPAIQRATWSWRRWALSTVPSDPVTTRWALLAPLAWQPAVIPGIYIGLAVVGFVAALALQGAVLAGAGFQGEEPLIASVIALTAGLVGAKVWYRVLHPDEPWLKGGGWAVDGFLVVAPLVAAFTLLAWDQPIGTVLDATAPGLFFAVALGRVGCFLTGCCAGRCTAAPWGVWSSDRRIGARRIPTQLIESAAGLTLAVVSLIVVVDGSLPVSGAIFLAAFAIYAIIRQGLLRLRAERRKEYRTLPLTAAAAGAVAVVVATLAIGQGR